MNYKLLFLAAVLAASACVVVQERPADGMPPPQTTAPAPPAPAATTPTASGTNPPTRRPTVRTPVLPGALSATDAGAASDAQ